MTTDEAARLSADPTTDPEILRRIVVARPDLAPVIAQHPRLDGPLAQALVALDDRAVDTVLAWRQPPPGGWGRDLVPEALGVHAMPRATSPEPATTPSPRVTEPPSSVPAPQQQPRAASGGYEGRPDLSNSAVFADPEVRGDAAGAGQVESKKAGRGRKAALVAGITAACVALAGAGGWLVHNFTKDGTSKGGTNTTLELQPYPSQPKATWTLKFEDAVAAAQSVNPDVDPTAANLSWDAYGDLALVSVTSWSGDDESADSATIAVDLTSGKVIWTLNPTQVLPGSKDVYCGFFGVGVITCTDANQTKAAWIDQKTGTPTQFDGDWVEVVRGVVLKTEYVSDGQVKLTAEESGKRLWDLSLSVPVENSRLLTHKPEEFANFTRAVSTSSTDDESSDLVTVALAKEGTCQTDYSGDTVTADSVCAASDGQYYIGVSLKTGKVRYSGQYLPLLDVGNELIVQDESKTQTTVSDGEPEMSLSTALVLNANGEQTGSINVHSVGGGWIGGSFAVNGSDVAVFDTDSVSLYEAGKWGQPSWTISSIAGEYGQNTGAVLQDTVIVFTTKYDDSGNNVYSVVGYDVRNGAERWREDARLLGIDDNLVILLSDLDRGIKAVSPDTGLEAWSYEADGTITRAGKWIIQCDWQKNCSGLKSP
ncbi:hypothetical protein [Rarobacter faecitabidus]|nr:hypothetical protein [Rarobacter faecitabidus]